jgi:hypothetical protein
MNKQIMVDHVNELIAKFGFNEVLDCSKAFYAWMEDTEEALDESGYRVSCGMCRAVIYHDDWDEVLKINFDKEDEIDYCANEVFIYEQAKLHGVDFAFAACEVVGTFFNTIVYAMERCECDADELSGASYSYQYKKYCEEEELDPSDPNVQDNFCCEEWDQGCMLDLAALDWGERAIQDVASFFIKFGVNDCHCGNWGKLGGKLVVVDYAGYGDGADLIRQHYHNQ